MADTPACPRDGELHDKNRVTLAATDGSPEQPDRRHPGDGGRGLALVDALSERWGLDEHHDGKRVWIVLIPHPATTQAH